MGSSSIQGSATGLSVDVNNAQNVPNGLSTPSRLVDFSQSPLTISTGDSTSVELGVNSDRGVLHDVAGQASVSVTDFVHVDGAVEIRKVGDVLLAGFADATTQLAAAAGTSEAVGFELPNSAVGIVLTDHGYALATSGNVSLIGLDGMNVSGSVDVRSNQLGESISATIPTSGSSVAVSFATADAVTSFSGDLTFAVVNAFELSGSADVTKDSGTDRLGMSMSGMSLAITPFGTEVYRIDGDGDFDINKTDGLLMRDVRIAGVSLLGLPFDLSVLEVEDPPGLPSSEVITVLPEVELAYQADGEEVDLRLLNRRGYLDVHYVDHSGSGIDADSVLDDDPEFTLSGDGLGDAEIDSVEDLGDDVFRYHFKDSDPSNDVGLFVEGEVMLAFADG